MDGERLLTSANAGDNVPAVLKRLGEQRESVRRVLDRIAAMRPGERDGDLAEFSIITGLRRMEDGARREATKMPVLNDIRDNKVIGPAIRRGLQQGRVEGQTVIMHSQIEKRFARITPTVAQRLSARRTAAARCATH
jgi:hypothetical protein